MPLTAESMTSTGVVIVGNTATSGHSHESATMAGTDREIPWCPVVIVITVPIMDHGIVIPTVSPGVFLPINLIYTHVCMCGLGMIDCCKIDGTWSNCESSYSCTGTVWAHQLVTVHVTVLKRRAWLHLLTAPKLLPTPTMCSSQGPTLPHSPNFTIKPTLPVMGTPLKPVPGPLRWATTCQ